jgi:hypothetical protein
VKVPLTAVCKNLPDLAHAKKLSPETCFQDWKRSVFGWRVLAFEAQRWAQVTTGMVKQGKEAWF